VATAIYEGADAVMLSAETAVGKYPVATVDMMNRIVQQVEADPAYRQLINASHNNVDIVQMDIAHATCSAMRLTVTLIHAAVVVSYTISGTTTLGAARERAEAPILSLTPNLGVARRMALVWGVHSVQIGNIVDVTEMTAAACSMARQEHFAEAGQPIVAIAGMPSAASYNVNFLFVATA
jgi:pyruvate kinase